MMNSFDFSIVDDLSRHGLKFIKNYVDTTTGSRSSQDSYDDYDEAPPYEEFYIFSECGDDSYNDLDDLDDNIAKLNYEALYPMKDIFYDDETDDINVINESYSVDNFDSFALYIKSNFPLRLNSKYSVEMVLLDIDRLNRLFNKNFFYKRDGIYYLSKKYLYIDSYKHISTNEKINKFKALGIRIMTRYCKYLNIYINNFI